MEQKFYDLLEYINDLWIIDTHEHFRVNEPDREKNTDVLKEYLQHYFNSDVISSGLSTGDFAFVTDHTKPILERWKVIEPYWHYSRKTGYGRALDISANGLYGINKICADTICELNEKFMKSLQPGHYHYVFKEKSKILISVVDQNLDCDPVFFRSVFRMDHFVCLPSMEQFYAIEKSLKMRICSFDDWLECCEQEMENAIKKGAVALKIPFAYQRSIFFDRVVKSDAEQEFNRILGMRFLPRINEKPIETTKIYQDYMMHYILRFANKRGMVVQIHTGIQEGNGNYLANSDPSLLCNIFLEYPDIKFDVFHISYPYQNVLTVLAKSFPNVYIDMCWAHMISPVASVAALEEWIECVPLNKISAFGGDYKFIDGVYGHSVIARENVAKALYAKIIGQVLDMDEAKEIAVMLFRTNPEKLLRLTDLPNL